MEEYIKIILFDIIYKELKLNEIENLFINVGVKSKKVDNINNMPLISKYFFLLNDVHLDYLSDIERNELEIYYSSSVLGDMSAKQKLYSFLKANLLKILIPRTDEKYLSWGPMGNFRYMAPSKSIVLAFHYMKYGNENWENTYELIIDKMNFIQEQYASILGVPVAVIMYDETFDVSKVAVKL